MIVNADDFGLGHAENLGIVEAFERRLISSTTLMPNQAGFDEAVELARERSLVGRVGVHLVLTDGVPLTDGIRTLGRFCDENGAFRVWSASAHAWRLSRQERECVERELRAQIERVRDAGFPVTHVDSHHHVHNEWAIGACVIRVCSALEVPCVRLARNCGPSIGRASRLYKRVFNARLARTGLAATTWFGGVTDWLHLRSTRTAVGSLDDFELMTHPRRDEDGRLVDAWAGGDLAALLAPVPQVASAVSYGEASGRPG